MGRAVRAGRPCSQDGFIPLVLMHVQSGSDCIFSRFVGLYRLILLFCVTWGSSGSLCVTHSRVAPELDRGKVRPRWWLEGKEGPSLSPLSLSQSVCQIAEVCLSFLYCTLHCSPTCVDYLTGTVNVYLSQSVCQIAETILQILTTCGGGTAASSSSLYGASARDTSVTRVLVLASSPR